MVKARPNSPLMASMFGRGNMCARVKQVHHKEGKAALCSKYIVLLFLFFFVILLVWNIVNCFRLVYSFIFLTHMNE